MTTPGQHRGASRITFLFGAALAVGIALAASTARAQDAYHCIEELSEDQLDYRIQKIQSNFEDGQEKAAAWRFGWMFALAGSLMQPTYNLVTQESPRAERFFEWAIIGGGIAAVLQLAVIPMPGVWGAKRIRRKPGKTIEEKRAKLRYATQTLEKSAKVQEYLGGPNYGGGGVVYGLVMGSVYVGLYHDENGDLPTAFDRRMARFRAAGLYLIPPVLSIGQAVSHPKHSYEYWEQYRGIACSSKYYDTSERGPELDLGFSGTSLTLKVRF
ncbi:MAG: hypothetical protein OES69_13595 [Myxococcales bacterium]|nr:hypothetical protein [Myxococcales bacterium]MDH3844971.1 hypothetical protein [Myxococcales bacterium]